MSNVTVCARFRPLNSKEKRDNGDKICIRSLDFESFVFKDEKDEDFTFCFDRVFYQESQQADVYEFLALPIVQDAVNAINGTIITYGQTGAGKTYSMEGLGILECDGEQKGLLPRVVDGLFECLRSVDEMTKYTVKLSMVEIYMEKVRDLFDLSKDNLQIKEGKHQGIFLSGVTELSISDPAEALHSLSNGIANRAVGETQMNMASSRSHCAYIFTIQLETSKDRRVKTGKLILVDLAGSEKVEKTGAEGRVLEEAKTINKSLSALGNVINALTIGTSGKANHIPYRDSKLTRILQDSLGGSSRTALLCCCSPSTLNSSESLSTLRFGARHAIRLKRKFDFAYSRLKWVKETAPCDWYFPTGGVFSTPRVKPGAKHIKTSPRVSCSEDKVDKKHMMPSPIKDDSCDRILSKLREKMEVEDVKLLEELFIKEGIIFNPNSIEDFESAQEDITFRTITSLHQTVEELVRTVEKLKRENKALKAKVMLADRFDMHGRNAEANAPYYFDKNPGVFSSFFSWVLRPLFGEKMIK